MVETDTPITTGTTTGRNELATSATIPNPPDSAPQAPIALLDAGRGTMKATTSISAPQLHLLEQELQRYQTVMDGLKEETSQARSEAAKARKEQQRIQDEIDKMKVCVIRT